MKSQKIAQNFLSIVTGQISSFVLNFLSISLAARHLGVEEFGQFGYLMAVVVVLAKLIDFGLVPIVFREMSIEKEDFRLFNTSLVFRASAFVLLAVLFNVYLTLSHAGYYETLFSNLLLLNILISSKVNNVRELMDVPFKAHIEMFTPSILLFIDNALFLILILLMPLVHGGIVYFYVSYLVTNIPGFVILSYALHKRYGYKISLDLYKLTWLLKVSFSIYVFILFNILFQQIDTILLKVYSTKYALGIYSAAIRLAIPLIIIPTAIIHTVFPLLNEKSDEQADERYTLPESKKKYLATTFKLIYILPFVLAVAFTIKPASLVGLVFGTNYIDASQPTIILLWAQVLFFHSFFVINILYVYDAQKWGIIYSTVLVVFDYLLCYLLIPQFAFMGAAWGKAIAITAGWLVTTVVIKKYSGSVFFPDLRLIFWSLLLFGAAHFMAPLPVFVFLVLFMVAAFVLAILVGILTNEEMRFILAVLHLEKYSDMVLKLYSRLCLFRW